MIKKIFSGLDYSVSLISYIYVISLLVTIIFHHFYTGGFWACGNILTFFQNLGFCVSEAVSIICHPFSTCYIFEAFFILAVVHLVFSFIFRVTKTII